MENINTNNTEGQSTESGTQEVVKTYTQEEVDALLQQETDRRVTSALKKQEAKNQAAIKEAEKLAKMNEQEKYEYQLRQREEAITAKEKQLALAENKNVASSILAEKGLSLSLVDFIVAEDADTMKNNIDILEKAFKQSVKLEVEKRMAGSTPKKNLPLDKPIDKAQFLKMSTMELSTLRRDNPELYYQLANS